MQAILNLLRVISGIAWTAIVALPMEAVIWPTYFFGRLAKAGGRPDILERVLAWNAGVMGWVAQSLWSPGILAIVGIRVIRREEVPIDWSNNHVVCANHASIFDIVALARTVPPPFRFVAKRELLRWPVIGWALLPAGQIVIDRRNRGEALRALASLAKRPIEGQVIFFVEGTRSRSGELLPFKKGAFHFAVDHRFAVLPTAVFGSFGVLGRVPWWRLHPGRDIEIRMAAPIEAPAADSPEQASAIAQSLLGSTRAAIVELLDEGEPTAAVSSEYQL